jgi:hypothetical protein
MEWTVIMTAMPRVLFLLQLVCLKRHNCAVARAAAYLHLYSRHLFTQHFWCFGVDARTWWMLTSVVWQLLPGQT